MRQLHTTSERLRRQCLGESALALSSCTETDLSSGDGVAHVNAEQQGGRLRAKAGTKHNIQLWEFPSWKANTRDAGEGGGSESSSDAVAGEAEDGGILETSTKGGGHVTSNSSFAACSSFQNAPPWGMFSYVFHVSPMLASTQPGYCRRGSLHHPSRDTEEPTRNPPCFPFGDK